MNHHWMFTDLEFVALWEPLREGALPQPFSFVTDIATDEEFQREAHRARERWRPTTDAALAQMLQDVARPDLAVVVGGSDGRDRNNPEGIIRVLGVRRESRGYVLTQLPGRTTDHSGGFTVTTCHFLDLAAGVVAALPDVPPGKLGRVTLPARDGMDHSHERPRWRDSFDDPRAKGQHFLQADVVTIGRIDIHQSNSRFGPRGRMYRVLLWRDLLDDGRYVIKPANPPVAIDADAELLTNMINAEIAEVVRAIKDERAFEDA